jgi:hypothetical protein
MRLTVGPKGLVRSIQQSEVCREGAETAIPLPLRLLLLKATHGSTDNELRRQNPLAERHLRMM